MRLPRVGPDRPQVQAQVLSGQLLVDQPLEQVSLAVLWAREQRAGVAVGGVHRGADPGHRRQAAQFGQRGDQAARATAYAPLAGARAPEAQGAAVGDDDQALVAGKKGTQQLRELRATISAARR